MYEKFEDWINNLCISNSASFFARAIQDYFKSMVQIIRGRLKSGPYMPLYNFGTPTISGPSIPFLDTTTIGEIFFFLNIHNRRDYSMLLEHRHVVLQELLPPH